jgi:hypothetical protein
MIGGLRPDGSQAFFGSNDAATIEIPLSDPRTPWLVHVHARLDEHGNVFVDHYTIQQKKGIEPGEERSIRLKGIPEELIIHQLETALGSPWSDRVSEALWANEETALPSTGHKLPPEHYGRVAVVWTQAERDRRRTPYNAVMKRWDVTKQTAWRWKNEAIRQGFLPPDEQRKELLQRASSSEEADDRATSELLTDHIFLERLRRLAEANPQGSAAVLLAEITDAPDLDYHPSLAFVSWLTALSDMDSEDAPLAAAAVDLLGFLPGAGSLDYPNGGSTRGAQLAVRELRLLANTPDSKVRDTADRLLQLLIETWTPKRRTLPDGE